MPTQPPACRPIPAQHAAHVGRHFGGEGGGTQARTTGFRPHVVSTASQACGRCQDQVSIERILHLQRGFGPTPPNHHTPAQMHQDPSLPHTPVIHTVASSVVFVYVHGNPVVHVPHAPGVGKGAGFHVFAQHSQCIGRTGYAQSTSKRMHPPITACCCHKRIKCTRLVTAPHCTGGNGTHIWAHPQREGWGAPALLFGGVPNALRMGAVYALSLKKMMVSHDPPVPSSLQVLAAGIGIHAWGKVASY